MLAYDPILATASTLKVLLFHGERYLLITSDVSSLDAQCVMALVMGVIRADRFFEGTLLDFLKDGSICKWLRRLDEIENYGMNGEKSTEETV